MHHLHFRGARRAHFPLGGLVVLAASLLLAGCGAGVLSGLALVGNLVGAVGGSGEGVSHLEQPYAERGDQMAAAGEAAAGTLDRRVTATCRSRLEHQPAPPVQTTGGQPACSMRMICLPGATAPIPMQLCQAG